MKKKFFSILLISLMAVLLYQAAAVYAHSAAEITFTISPNTAKVSESVTFNVSAPGAEKIEIYSGNNEKPWKTADGDRDNFSSSFSSKNESTWNFTARALFDGVWTEKTAPVQLQILQPEGELEQVNATVPSEIQQYASLSVTYEPVEHADYYYYYLCPYSNETCYTNGRSIDPYRTSFEVVETVDLAPGTYVLGIRATGIGWYYSYKPYSFMVKESSAERPAAPVVTIDESKLDYFDENKDSIKLGSGVYLKLTTPKAEKLRCKTTYPSNYTYTGVDSTQYYSYNNGSYDYSVWRTNDEGVYSVSFSVMIGGIWSPYSDALSYTVKTKGKLAVPEVTIPSEVNVGKPLPVTIKVAENVEEYEISICNEGYTQCWWGDGLSVQGEESLSKNISLEAYEPGTYGLMVTSVSEGYQRASNQSLKFSIVGSLPAAPQVSTNTTSIKRSQSIKFIVTAPGITIDGINANIRYQTNVGNYYTNAMVDSETSEVVVNGYELFYAQPQHIRFKALIGDVWSAWSDWVDVTVTDLEQLSTPEISVSPTKVTFGQNFSLTITPVENAKIYSVNAYTLVDGYVEGEWKFGRSYSADEITEGAIMLGSSLEPGTYRIRVYAENYDEYNMSEPAWVDVEVIESDIAGPTLTVDKTEVYYAESFTLTVLAAEGESVRFYFENPLYNNSWYGDSYLNNGKAEYNTSVWETGTRIVTARVLFADGTLSKASDPVTITIISLGKLETPSVDIPETVDAYKTLKFNVTAQQETESLSSYLYYISDDPDSPLPSNEWVYNSSMWLAPDSDNNFAYTIARKDLPAGLYRVQVYANASKWEQSDPLKWYFRAYGEDNGIPGDMNGDGYLNVLDVIRLRRYITDPSSVEIFANPNTNGDNRENVLDVIRLRRYIADPSSVEIF